MTHGWDRRGRSASPLYLQLPILIAALLPAFGLRATTFVPPRDLGELALGSDAVVLARAASSVSSKRGALILTYTDFEVEEDLAGGLAANEVIRVQVPGGSVDGEIWSVPGTPSFKSGESYLLCLKRKSDRLWLPSIISYGTFHRSAAKGGAAILTPIPEEHGWALARPDGQEVEMLTVYYENPLLDHLREVLAGRESWDSSGMSAVDELGTVVRKAPPGECAFFSSNGRNFRWRAFDTGGRATMFADAAGDLSLPGGGFDLVPAAMDLWMGVTDSSVNLTYGGPREVSLDCAGGQDSQTNVIVFNDPCSDIGSLQGCSGTLAFGGPRASGTHTFDGATWITITGWIVVVNDGTGCLGENNYTRMLAHELGHGLGFGHVSDSNALMFASCCRNVNSTDRTCLRYTYPAIDPANERPNVDAGNDQVVSLARNTIRLRGAISDDGLPANPGAVTSRWVAMSGPGEAVFADESAMETTVTFSRSGSYLLGLEAFDGQLLGADTITLDVDLWAGSSVTASFQQRALGYSGTVDTQLSENEPSFGFASSAEIGVDDDDPSGSGLATHVLLRFDGIFGRESGQIPPGSAIYTAWLELATTNVGDGATVHRVLDDWSDDATWNGFGNGLAAGVEALSVADSTVTGADGTVRVDVTTSLAAWSAAPCENHGWALLPRGDDGWDFSSSEGSAPPKLVVVYSAVSEETPIEVGDEWLYFKGVSEPDPEWTLPEFDPDASWLSGPSGIGFGDGDDATVLNDMRGAYASIFCRRAFPVVAPETIGRLTLRIDYDDGFVAYLNGEEVARSPSMGAPGSPVDRNTLAASRESGEVEEYALDPAGLRAGTNVLAIQVHNATVSSTDLSFIPELRVLPDVVDEGATWRFLRGSVAIPAEWNQPGFDDAAWESGPSGIGFGDGDDATELTDMQGQYLSVFFRRTVDLRNLSRIDEVLLTVIYDDGVAVWVNGVEIGRENLPAGTISRQTAASGNGETEVTTFAVPVDLLVEGENLIAASVHNASLASSDLSFVPVLVVRRATAESVFCGEGFLRGDANDDSIVDLGDAVTVLFHLFRGEAISCADAADPNDDGALDQADAVYLLTYLFQAGAAPASPGVECGEDPTEDELGECVTIGCSR